MGCLSTHRPRSPPTFTVTDGDTLTVAVQRLPPPFQALNAPVPRCEEPEGGALLHLVLPPGETEFSARNVTVALVEFMQMRDLPNGTDWFVVGASEAGSQIHVTTVGEERIDEQHVIIAGAIESIDDAWEVPAMWHLVFLQIPIESVFISALKIEALGTFRYTTVAARRDDVDADTQPSPRPINHHG